MARKIISEPEPEPEGMDIYSPSQPLRADQAVFAHTMMAPAPSWQEGPSL